MRKIEVYVIIVAFVSLCGIIGCSNFSNGNAKFSKRISLEGELIQNIYTYNPSQLLIVDSTLLIINNSNNEIFQFADISCDSVVLEFGKKGRGASEFMSPRFTGQVECKRNGDKVFHVYDGTRRLYSKINLNECLRSNGLKFERNFRLKHDIPKVSKVYRLNDNKMYFSSFGPEPTCRFYIYETETSFLEEVSYLPDFGIKIHKNNLYPVYASVGCWNVINNNLILAPALAREIDFFSNEGEYLRSTIIDRPAYLSKASSSQLIFKEKPRLYYSQLVSTDSLIYALHYNKKISSGKGVYSSQVDIFNFKGEPVAELLLNKYVTNIAIDIMTNTIYGICPEEPKYALVRFNLD